MRKPEEEDKAKTHNLNKVQLILASGKKKPIKAEREFTTKSNSDGVWRRVQIVKGNARKDSSSKNNNKNNN